MKDQVDPTLLFYAEVGGKWDESLQPRWRDVREVADLRESDHVLDVGCAEGLITMEVAGLVERAHGFDILEQRVEIARRIAAERGISNVTFAHGSVADTLVAPMSYDVTLFLGVWGKHAGDGRRVGGDDLRKILHGTRRQLIARVGIQRPDKNEARLAEILRVCDECGFDAICFNNPPVKRSEDPGGNLIVANRRGTDARLRMVPTLVLIPSECLLDDPVIASAR